MFIFLIDSNPLISEWLQRLAEKLNYRFYHLPHLDEAAYFINDLNPDVLVIDGDVANKSKGDFIASLQDYPILRKIPVIGLGSPLPDWSSLLNVQGHIQKPLNPANFFDQVKSKL